MKAITTKFLGATNTKGSRIKAYDSDGNQKTIGYDHALNPGKAHKKAAIALCKKMGWPDDLVGGGVKEGYVWCFSDSWVGRD